MAIFNGKMFPQIFLRPMDTRLTRIPKACPRVDTRKDNCVLHVALCGRENGIQAKGQPRRIRGNHFPHSSRALSDAAETYNATWRADNLHANADNGLAAKHRDESKPRPDPVR